MLGPADLGGCWQFVEFSATHRLLVGSQPSSSAPVASCFGYLSVAPTAPLPHFGRPAVKSSAKIVEIPMAKTPTSGGGARPERSERRLPLSWLIVVPFATQCLVVLAITSYIGLHSSRTIATDKTQALLAAVGRHINAHLQRTFDAYDAIVRLTEHDVANGHWPTLLTNRQLDHVGGDLWEWMQVLPTIDRLIFVDPKGNLQGISRVQGWRRLSSRGNASLGQQQPLDRLGRPMAAPRPYEITQAQLLPWFTKAVQSDRPVWSGLGSDLDQQLQSGLLPNEAFLKYSWVLRQPQTGKLLGVMSADLRLLEIDRILQTIELDDRARAFVFTDEGWLIASSSHRRVGEIAIRPPEHLSETADLILRSANSYLRDRFDGFHHFPPQSTQLYSFDGQRYLMHLSRCQSAIAPGLWIGVVAPETNFLSETQNTASTLTLLAGAALLLALASAWWMVQQVLRPLQQLNRAAGAAARIQFQSVSDRSGVVEFDALADTFNAMAATLRTTFDALQENEARLSQVLESLPIGLLALSAEGFVHYANSVAAYLFELPTGRQPNQVTYDDIHDLIFCAGSDRPFLRSQLPGCLALGGQASGAVQLDLQHDERRIPLEVRAVPLFDNLGQVMGAIVVLQDITDRKIAEELLVSYNQTLEQQVMERTAALEIANHNLASARDAAEQANRAKTVFLANVTHELRTPLHAILGFGQLLRAALASAVTHPQPVHSTTSYLDAIARNGAYLLQLIDDLLSISHMEAEQLSLEIGDVDLRALLNDLFDIFEMRSRSVGVRWQMGIDSHLPASVRSDGRRLRQILTNLLDNAFKFSDSLGEVSLVVLSGPNPGDWQFAVSNTGEGIQPNELTTIFEPFVQANAGRNSGQGTGLGLAICHNLAQLMGGRLTAESQPGQLTTFRLWVSLVPCMGASPWGTVAGRSLDAVAAKPLSIATDPQCLTPLAGAGTAHDYPDPIGSKILLVDALPDRAQDAHHYLAGQGFAVRSVATGRDALRQYATWQPSLVWFHLPLAGDEGLATLRRIRAIERKKSRPPCKVLVMFAQAGQQQDWQALDCTLLKNPLPIGPVLVDAAYGLLEPAPVCPLFPTTTHHLRVEGDALSTLLQSQLASQSLVWRLALERAARSADEEAIHRLLAELAPEWRPLREAIEHWVSEFQLEKIADLAHPEDWEIDDEWV
ncbi:MAG: HAMP domain-containing protein [Oscillatoriales cyanobacterium]|nr:MAG: HAMP domain-containing protein [Oscillatoriales cyanobacterium]